MTRSAMIETFWERMPESIEGYSGRIKMLLDELTDEQLERVMGYLGPDEVIHIQYDKSGVGHCWVAATEDNCPANIRDEIAAEVIDEGTTECADYVASNGQHYRWR